ncbi:hypothetical protein, partial [Pseudomonas syringae group genomosp. 7]|uniref:hypothetical protein n=1 Tax=Pseudomonas syringae group genomosp. 7 TaxID=251699 RepID=UPI00376FC0E5
MTKKARAGGGGGGVLWGWVGVVVVGVLGGCLLWVFVWLWWLFVCLGCGVLLCWWVCVWCGLGWLLFVLGGWGCGLVWVVVGGWVLVGVVVGLCVGWGCVGWGFCGWWVWGGVFVCVG